MGFERSFDKVKMMQNDPLFITRLMPDIIKGNVYPAVRKKEFHFYYGGGCLFKFSGSSFKRNPAYEYHDPVNPSEKKEFPNVYVTQNSYRKIDGKPRSFTENYETFKQQNKKKFGNFDDDGTERVPCERQFLEEYYHATYAGNELPNVCVLDIEVRVNEGGSRKKCDMVLYNKIRNEIMFVEGKLFNNSDLDLSWGKTKVIEQVSAYTSIINYQDKATGESATNHIEAAYAKYIEIVSGIFFNSSKDPQSPLRLIRDAKLLVFETPDSMDGVSEEKRAGIAEIDKSAIKTLWVPCVANDNLSELPEKYPLEYIWESLCK